MPFFVFMTNRDKLIIDVSGAWVREVSPVPVKSHLFSPEHLGNLSYEHDSKAITDRDKKQMAVPLR